MFAAAGRFGRGCYGRRRTFTIAFFVEQATGVVMGGRLLLRYWPRSLVVATLISAVDYRRRLAQAICGPLYAAS